MENNIEKAHSQGDKHPNGKWYWESSAAGGKGDWRTIKGSSKDGGKKDGGSSASKIVGRAANGNAIVIAETRKIDNSKKTLPTGNAFNRRLDRGGGELAGLSVENKIAKIQEWIESQRKSLARAREERIAAHSSIARKNADKSISSLSESIKTYKSYIDKLKAPDDGIKTINFTSSRGDQLSISGDELHVTNKFGDYYTGKISHNHGVDYVTTTSKGLQYLERAYNEYKESKEKAGEGEKSHPLYESLGMALGGVSHGIFFRSDGEKVKVGFTHVKNTPRITMEFSKDGVSSRSYIDTSSEKKALKILNDEGFEREVNGVRKSQPMDIEKAENLLFGEPEQAPLTEFEKAENVLGI